MKIGHIILQVPLWLLILGSFVGSIYAAVYKIQGTTYATPTILLIIIILYITGRILSKIKNNEYHP